MATRVDALRSTLDQLALDPRAQEDRPYLISMLRRLGYSDVEIQAALGPIDDSPAPEAPETTPATTPEPAPAPEPARASQVDPRPRVVEVEYTGPDYSEEFQRVGPDGRPIEGDSTQFAVGSGGAGADDEDAVFDEDGEVAGYEGEGEDFGDFDMGAVDAVEDSWDDDWGEGDFGSALEAREGESTEDMSDAERRKLLEELGLDPDDESIADFGTRARPKYNQPKKGSTRLMEFQEFQPHEAEGRMVTDDDTNVDELPWTGSEAFESGAEEFGTEDLDDLPAFEPEATTEAWEPEEASPWEPEQTDTTDTAWGEQEEWPESDEDLASPEAAFTYRDYTLYTRDVELSTGRSQRIYFFAKNEPKNGEPSPLPDGYEVKENEQTGLPFLRRVHHDPAPTLEEPAPEPAEEPAWEAPEEPAWEAPEEPAWEEIPDETDLPTESPADEPATAGKKRVRAVRVKARNREEAEAMMRDQGKDVRGSVPIEFDDGET